ncbi:hypothetical protein FRC19_005030 [Serendipita sp. 401]|nr:hypothetical protein FRC19_005030 [Serendipita sp. 401]
MNVDSVITNERFERGEAVDGDTFVRNWLRDARTLQMSTTTIYSNTNTRQKATFSSEFASTPADDLASSNAVGSTASSSLSSKKTMGREGGGDIRQDF